MTTVDLTNNGGGSTEESTDSTTDCWGLPAVRGSRGRGCAAMLRCHLLLVAADCCWWLSSLLDCRGWIRLWEAGGCISGEEEAGLVLRMGAAARQGGAGAAADLLVAAVGALLGCRGERGISWLQGELAGLGAGEMLPLPRRGLGLLTEKRGRPGRGSRNGTEEQQLVFC